MNRSAVLIILSLMFIMNINANIIKDNNLASLLEIALEKLSGDRAIHVVHYSELAKKVVLNTKKGKISISVLGTAKLFEMNFNESDKCESKGSVETTIRLLKICDNLSVASIETGNFKLSLKTINNKWKIIYLKSQNKLIKYFLSNKFKCVM